MGPPRSVLVGKENAASYLNGKMIVILVGEEENQAAHSFYVHKELLVRRSAFFAKTLEGYAALDKDEEFIKVIKWKEGTEGTIKLPKDDPEIFAAYVHLIYYEELPISQDLEPPVVSPKATPGEQKRAQIQLDHLVGEAVEHEYDIMSKLYVFCDKIQDCDAKKVIIEAFVEAASKTRANGRTYYCTAFTIDYLYEYTTSSDPIRQFLTDCYVFKGASDWVSKREDAYPMDFLRDVMIGMLKHRTQPYNADRLEISEYYTWRMKDSEIRKRDQPFQGRLVRALKK